MVSWSSKYPEKLPSYTVARYRKRLGGFVFYFSVPERLRPEGWTASLGLDGTVTDGMSTAERLTVLSSLSEQVDGDKGHKARLDAEKDGAPIVDSEKTMRWLIAKYEHESDEYRQIKDKTKEGYNYCARQLVKWADSRAKTLGRQPLITELTRKSVIAYLKKDPDMRSKPRKRSLVRTYLKIILDFAVDEGLIESNPAANIRLSGSTTRASKVTIWTDQQLLDRVAAADAQGWKSVGTAMMIVHEVGQRPTDARNLQKPRDYQGGMFRFYQSKTKSYVTIPATKRLAERLNELPREQLPLVLNEHTQAPFSERNLSNRVRRIQQDAKLECLLLRDLRHTAVVNLARAGLTVAQIGAVTGHSLKRVDEILAKYWVRDSETAVNAIARLEDYRAQKLNESG